MDTDELNYAVEQINAGAQIPQIQPSQIEHVWEVLSRIPVERRTNAATGLTLACASSDFAAKSPDEQVALMTRYALLDALLERGVLNDYMNDALGRKRVFAAAATLPCDGNDLAEALAERMLGDASPEVMERTREEMKNAGRDLDRPKIGEKFIGWIRSYGCDV
jgi:hypothetical protein